MAAVASTTPKIMIAKDSDGIAVVPKTKEVATASCPAAGAAARALRESGQQMAPPNTPASPLPMSPMADTTPATLVNHGNGIATLKIAGQAFIVDLATCQAVACHS
jgi:hypothetical protein